MNTPKDDSVYDLDLRYHYHDCQCDECRDPLDRTEATTDYYDHFYNSGTDVCVPAVPEFPSILESAEDERRIRRGLEQEPFTRSEVNERRKEQHEN